MSEVVNNFEAIAIGSEDIRVEALREFLGYPLQELDKTDSGFWYLRAGRDIAQARQTCPIAVCFYEELDSFSDAEIKVLLTATAQQERIYGHYLNQEISDMPVMYLLLPVANRAGRVAFVLPMEGGLRQRQIETFAWNQDDLRSRLVRLKQENLVLTKRLKFTDVDDDQAPFSIPSVEWAFYKTAKTAKELAQLLAEVTRRIEQVLPVVYEAEAKGGYLHQLLLSFQRELLPSLKLAAESEKDYSFADIYAQTIAYGLFTARVFSFVRDPLADFNRRDAWQQLPETNPFLRRLFEDVSKQKPDELGTELASCIAEVFAILRAAKMDAILSDFREKMNREDIVIRFYEDFLAAYKPKMRERRGVYYTPEPVVSYMVRSVDILIKEKFGKPLGLLDPEVMILDPACGTGTFLLWIFKLIEERFKNDGEARSLIQQKLGDISWSDYVKDHLLPRVFGFELLMAPYAICHLKLGLFLEESGYLFGSSQRLGVYLTNTLDDAAKKSEILFQEYIAEESNQAAEIKRNQPIMVVIGNPPYSVSSANKSKWILDLIQDYKIGLNEKKLNLDDDYIKFIRFAQHRISVVGYGILCFITNHSYLSGLIHRKMRQSLNSDFSEINLIDLHGNSIKRETTPKGELDENVFDIQTGVNIMLAHKLKIEFNQTSNKVYHFDLYGDRKFKYQYMIDNSIKSTNWNSIKPEGSSYHFFCPKNFELQPEYDECLPISDIFIFGKSGVSTDRDALCFDDSISNLENKIETAFSLQYSSNFKEEYRIEPSSSYDIVTRLKNNIYSSLNIKECLYRPFDKKWLYYQLGFTSRPAYEILKHLLLPNMCLIVKRQAREDSQDYSYFYCADSLVVNGCFSIDNKGRETLFPLFLYPETEAEKTMGIEKQSNFSKEFLTEITNKLGYTPTPEAIFYYIYAIFHSPTYRTRYAEFLKIDFPRLPLTSDDNLFRQLAQHGEALVALHLMKSPKLDQPITQFIENGGDSLVDAGHPKYADGNITINKKGDKFTGIPESVWNFYVGGYQVCHKWLKDRKGRQLSPADIQHYQKIVVALSETMEIMKAIDAAIPLTSFPIK